jgi:hypothetical protein
MLNVHWFKCGTAPNGDWCNLNNVNLQTVTDSGVYIIWHEGNPGKTLYVGQGDPISDRLAAHRNDKRIQAYANLGLRVTWATIPAAQRNGVERYLADWLVPLVGDPHPDAVSIQVNSPWVAQRPLERP